MKAIQNMKIGARLACGFGVIVALIVIMVAIAVNGVSTGDTKVRMIIDEDFEKVRLLGAITEVVNDNAQYMLELLLAADPNAAAQQAAARSAANVAKNNEAYKKLEGLVQSESGKKMLAAMMETRKAFIEHRTVVIDLIKKGQRDEARKRFDAEVAPLIVQYKGAITKLSDHQVKRIAESRAGILDANKLTLQTMSAGLAVALLIAGLAAYFITRSITRPVARAVSAAQSVANGDLDVSIDVTSKDEIGQLLAAMQRMQEQLTGTVTGIKQSADTISSASQQIATGNADLSQRTEEQASSLEETASSMEELTSTVKQNAENAKQANQLAASASEVAVKGGEVVGQVVTTMSSINESSKKIADIISVIDGIAFQTNILALNAAVEAARAGEQGRGFAVVATEVRNLAQRSAAAAKEIKELISNSVAKVEDGTKLVDEAGKTMEEIVGSVKRVTDIMAEITAASQEQSGGIEQVNTAITQMDQVTQQNAALVEEAAAAAESMQEQAQALAQAVSVFKLPAGSRDAGMHKVAAIVAQPAKPAAKVAVRFSARDLGRTA